MTRDRLTAWQDRHPWLSPLVFGPVILAPVAALAVAAWEFARLTGIGA